MRGKVNRKSSADVKSARHKINQEIICHLSVSNPKNKHYHLAMDVNRRTQLQVGSQQFFTFQRIAQIQIMNSFIIINMEKYDFSNKIDLNCQ